MATDDEIRSRRCYRRLKEFEQKLREAIPALPGSRVESVAADALIVKVLYFAVTLLGEYGAFIGQESYDETLESVSLIVRERQ